MAGSRGPLRMATHSGAQPGATKSPQALAQGEFLRAEEEPAEGKRGAPAPRAAPAWAEGAALVALADRLPAALVGMGL